MKGHFLCYVSHGNIIYGDGFIPSFFFFLHTMEDYG